MTSRIKGNRRAATSLSARLARDTAKVGLNGELEADSLRAFGAFSNLEPAKLKRLAGAMSLVRFPRGHRVLLHKDERKDVFLLLRGVVAVVSQNGGHGHPRVLVSLLAPGEVFGTAALLPDVAQSLKCFAFIDCLIATIDSTELFDILLKVRPTEFKAVMEMTAGWFGTALMRYVKRVRLPLSERLVAALVELGSKFGVQDSRGLLLTVPITQTDLAHLLTASRQNINACLRRLVKTGAIIMQRRQIILVSRKLIRMPESLQSNFPSQLRIASY